jgi:hypothetical protein
MGTQYLDLNAWWTQSFKFMFFLGKGLPHEFLSTRPLLQNEILYAMMHHCLGD